MSDIFLVAFIMSYDIAVLIEKKKKNYYNHPETNFWSCEMF